jgi:hypothetical protein
MTTKRSSQGRDDTLRLLLAREYPVTLHPAPEGGYVAEIRDLPGCISQGDTREEVLAMVDDARAAPKTGGEGCSRGCELEPGGRFAPERRACRATGERASPQTARSMRRGTEGGVIVWWAGWDSNP